jgi:hypothetical protein
MRKGIGLMVTRLVENVMGNVCFAMEALLMIVQDVLQDTTCYLEPPAKTLAPSKNALARSMEMT